MPLEHELKPRPSGRGGVTIANEFNRGKFSFGFALQIFKALGLKKLNLEDL